MTKLESKLTSLSPIVLSVFRVVLALLLLCHATSHLFGFPVARQQAPVGSWPIWWGGLIEVVAGVLILAGLITRLAAFIASGVMAYAYFMQHQPKSFWPIINNGEPAVLLCFGFFLLVFTGGGAWALDAMRSKR
ncbi:MAG: putative oxidoreductase [Mycobacterium sp.]|nr:putative oxidoreductase [Mycobacterium sp.]MDT5388277.1 putative oxidoreductase [Mycobacterium sp.]MDT5402939.1 putative oxidoreductase [Mycobacterium sp.]